MNTAFLSPQRCPITCSVVAGTALAMGGLFLLKPTSDHTPRKYGPPATSKAPTPPVGHQGTFHPSCDDKVWLFSRKWEPPAGKQVVASCTILHGTVDHSGQYDELGNYLASRGIAVFATDMRGWGLSDGDPLHYDNPQVFVKDVVSMDAVHPDSPRYAAGIPKFLIGKSIGGLIAARAALEHPEIWNGGLICLSPAFSAHREVKPPPALRAILRGVQVLNPKMPIKPVFDPKLIVSDQAALEKWQADPLVAKGKATAAYFVNILDEMDRLVSDSNNPQKKRSDTPVLMLWGTGDKVVSKEGCDAVIKLFRAPDSKLVTYEGGFHNLINEPAHQQKVFSDISTFILKSRV